MDETAVAIVETASTYPIEPPFHPDTHYPEFGETKGPLSEENRVFESVRELLIGLGLDRERFGQPDWNPLSTLVEPGGTVVIKPNLISQGRKSRGHTAEWWQVVTNGSVVRAAVDYAVLAVGSSGKIFIADGPDTDADFEQIVRVTGLDSVAKHIRSLGLECELLDLRRERWIAEREVLVDRVPLAGDPAGYVEVALDGESHFSDYALSGRFYGADYDDKETVSYHSDGRHCYVMCRTPMKADLIIDIPKLKTHRKTGVTLCMKNLVGVTGLRNCLPHFTLGSPEEKGDEFPPGTRAAHVQSRAIRAFKRVLAGRGGTGGWFAKLVKGMGRLVFGPTSEVNRSGNWHGNDTTWRMVLDLNRIVRWFNADGSERGHPRTILCIVDGIVAGESDGPLDPDAKPIGLLAAGLNPVAVDTACTILMGFDEARIPMVARGWGNSRLALAGFAQTDVDCRATRPEWCGTLASLRQAPHLAFRPASGWRGHVERSARDPHAPSRLSP